MVSELLKIDVHVHSYISEFENIFSNEVDAISKKISDCALEINKLKNSIYFSSENSDPNFKLFSPSFSQDEEQNKICHTKIVEMELQLEIYRQKYSDANAKLNNIKAINTYISILENGAFSKESETNNTDKSDVKTNNISTIYLDKSPDDNLLIYDEIGIKILETQEIERKRIARDLHDSTVQNLTNLVHKAELCTKLVDLDTIRTKLELETMISTIRSTINDMRNIIYDLRPMSLDDLGLVVTVNRYISQIMNHNDIKINFKVINEEFKILPVINSTLYRIIQESCNNSLKHAKAKHISIYLEYNSDYIILMIEDDGKGFESEKKGNDSNVGKSKFGLSIMRERIYLLSGNIEIASSIDSGTKISVRVPLSTYHGGK